MTYCKGKKLFNAFLFCFSQGRECSGTGCQRACWSQRRKKCKRKLSLRTTYSVRVWSQLHPTCLKWYMWNYYESIFWWYFLIKTVILDKLMNSRITLNGRSKIVLIRLLKDNVFANGVPVELTPREIIRWLTLCWKG